MNLSIGRREEWCEKNIKTGLKMESRISFSERYKKTERYGKKTLERQEKSERPQESK